MARVVAAMIFYGKEAMKALHIKQRLS